MVKIGFIGEGYSEVLFIKSPQFRVLLESLGIGYVPEPINALGQDNLRLKLDSFRANLQDEGANLIVILTDLDNAQTKTRKKENIGIRENQLIVLAIRAFESWFLADTLLMRQLLKNKQFEFAFPENEEEPFETIRRLWLEHTNQGIGKDRKRLFAQKYINNGFSIQRAAQHPNCPSATYFLNKLTKISPQPPKEAIYTKTSPSGAGGQLL